jgi:hypothetical protein
VAANLFDMWRLQGPDSDFSRKSYSNAVSSLRNSFADPAFYENTEQLLGTMFLLDFYESLSRRLAQKPESDMHLTAAIAIMKRLGPQACSTDVARRIFTVLRSRHILYNLQNRKRVELGENMIFDDERNNPASAKLDLVLAKIANLIYDCKDLVRVGPPSPAPSVDSLDSWEGEMTYEVLLLRCLEINSALDEWERTIPTSWQPLRNTQPESIHHSIRAVGLYNGLCDVYVSTAVSHTYNGWRTNKVLILRLIKHCLNQLALSPSYADFISLEDIDEQIQAFVDDICASVPFFLGSRTTLTLPHEPAHYPPVPDILRDSAGYLDSIGQPTTMTDGDHSRAAASTGGWFLLGPMTIVLQYCKPMPNLLVTNAGPDPVPVAIKDYLQPLALRRGQMEWILGQVSRIQKMYIAPLMVKKPPAARRI